jgi:hypothetical protein
MGTSYAAGILRSTTRGLFERIPRATALRGRRPQLLSALVGGRTARCNRPWRPGREEWTSDTLSSLMGSERESLTRRSGSGTGFDGRGRYNPRIAWITSTSYAQRTMANNDVEYWGVIAGLREARERGWTMEVVRDSNLILGSMPSTTQQAAKAL